MMSHKRPTQAKILSLLNQKGGVGKTTMVYNLAFAFAQQGKSVLCIDMDPQANLSLLFDLEISQEENSYHIFHLLINSIRELKVMHQPVLVSDVIRSKEGVDILPSGANLSGFELTVAGISSPRQLILKRFLEKSGLLERYDYILMDGPPTLGLLVINMICASQGMLIPFQADQFSRHGLGHLHMTLEDVAEMGICEIPQVLGYIPNLVEGRRKQEEKDFVLIKKELDESLIFNENKVKGKIFEPFTNRVQLVKANAQKKSVFSFKAKEYEELQQQFLAMTTYIQERTL